MYTQRSAQRSHSNEAHAPLAPVDRARFEEIKKFLKPDSKAKTLPQLGLPFGDTRPLKMSLRLVTRTYKTIQAIAFYRRIPAGALINEILKNYVDLAPDADDAILEYRRRKIEGT